MSELTLTQHLYSIAAVTGGKIIIRLNLRVACIAGTETSKEFYSNN